jgi:hypothetical protein
MEREKKGRNSINADKFQDLYKNLLLLPVGLRIGEQTQRHTHAIMLTVLQSTFVVIFLKEPVNFWFVLLIYYCRSVDSWLAPEAPSLCVSGGPDARTNLEATESAGPASVGHGAIREGLNWSGNHQTTHHQVLHPVRTNANVILRVGSSSLASKGNTTQQICIFLRQPV